MNLAFNLNSIEMLIGIRAAIIPNLTSRVGGRTRPIYSSIGKEQRNEKQRSKKKTANLLPVDVYSAYRLYLFLRGKQHFCTADIDPIRK